MKRYSAAAAARPHPSYIGRTSGDGGGASAGIGGIRLGFALTLERLRRKIRGSF